MPTAKFFGPMIHGVDNPGIIPVGQDLSGFPHIEEFGPVVALHGGKNALDPVIG